MCSEIQDGGKVAEPSKVEIVALSEKATPENTKKQLNMELRANNTTAMYMMAISVYYIHKSLDNGNGAL